MTLPSLLSEVMQESEEKFDPSKELNVSFEYQCNANGNLSTKTTCEFEISTGIQTQDAIIMRSNSSFFGLSCAALSANVTLANTNICNGIIGEEILPGLDSPKSFKRLSSSSSLSKLDLLASSSQSSISTLGGSAPSDNDFLESGKNILTPMSAPTRIESYSCLNTMDVQLAGGAAGEDRVQAVCSEENGWLFCGVYDGFNGRDAADFLAGTFYENVGLSLQMLEWYMKQQEEVVDVSSHKVPLKLVANDVIKMGVDGDFSNLDIENKLSMFSIDVKGDITCESYRHGVLKCLALTLAQAESDFMYMVEQEMENRPDLVSIGSSVLVILLHGMDLYILNLGDSRAVLATSKDNSLQAIQLTEIHTVDNEVEYQKLLADHPDDPSPVIGGRVKGRLKLTRAFGVGYLKKSKLNDALMGILRVRNLCSPPYVYTHPYTTCHRVTENDLFVVLGSDGLFDFFDNNEVVQLVYQFVQDNPFGDPAKFLIEQLVLRVAERTGFSLEELMRIPLGRRRKYHDDVTVIVIILGNKQRISSASTSS
uniref:protein-serine/threonine phosphatase n=1 Tax=Anthurium amnicola TaxID=1678845 RepID=A0A1D1Y620_9ARAE